ncbi:MAG: hypothetical protein MI757_12810 [Pirellulales bacterium]|nr:hypothetical protein [Pirellulales bacterium]
MRSSLAARHVFLLLLSFSLSAFFASPLVAAESPAAIKFFFFNNSSIEWIVSDDADAFAEHLSANEDSKKLYDDLVAALGGSEPVTQARSHMARWIARQREQFEQGTLTSTQFRKSEGVVAYLRAHGFSAAKLVDALKERTGASDVEIVAVHRQSQQDSSYWIKVIPVDPRVDMGRKGYNIEMQNPEVGYVSAVYALGFAIYEVEELVTENEPADDPEELPSPDDSLPELPATN